MVNRSLLFLLLCLFLPGLACAAPELELIVDKTEVQLGHHINAKLYGRDLSAKLSELDTSVLSEDFGISIQESSADDSDENADSNKRRSKQHVQILQFTLYPRRVGALSIPALHLAGLYSKAQAIEVTAGIKKSPQGNTPIERDILISTKHPWERQQVRIELQITAADKFVSLRSETPKITGFEVYPLPEQKEQIQRNGKQYSRVRGGWILFPLLAGDYTLDLPAIEYRQSGRTLRTFYLPKQRLTVKPLPPYIPPTIPVGKISIDSRLEMDKLPFPNTLYYWNINLDGTGVSPHWLPPVLRQLKSDTEVRFIAKDSQQRLIFDDTGLHSRVTHRIPFKASSNGKLSLPELRIQFFDPDNGKLESMTHQVKTPFVVSSGWRMFIAAIILLLLLRSAHLLYTYISRRLKRHRLRQSAFQKIKLAANTDDIRQALAILANAENWPTNMTLRQWTRQWKNRYRVDHHFDAAFRQLSQACYQTNRPTDFNALRATLFQQLAHKQK